MRFDELSAHPALLRAIAAHGYEEPTAVQAAVLGADAAGRDLLVSSRTGSGKTIAFGLALAPMLLGDAEKLAHTPRPLALVVAPTRELAQQVAGELSWLYRAAGGKVLTCVGGTSPREEAKALAQGAHIVVGTPGRLCDHLDRKQLRIEAIHALVLDEADEMLDMGFRDELERILRDAPPNRRTLLFSATLPKEIEELAGRYQKHALRIVATPRGEAHADIAYRGYLIAVRDREHAVVNLLRAHEDAQALVFCETRRSVTHLHANLVERGFPAVALSGELTQAERTRALQSLRDRRARVLVATDVAARGLDLPEMQLVIHADLPHDAEVMQHRSGRTGRAGRKGIAAVLVPLSRKMLAERLFARAKVKATWAPVPTADEILALDQDRLVRELEAAAESPDEADLAVARRLLQARSAEQLTAALVKLQRASRPAPEDLGETKALLSRSSAPGKRPAPHHAPRDRAAPGQAAPRPFAAPSGDEVMFRINVGREKNADPKWLIPLLCRRGKVTKADIGKIRIGPKETLVSISARAAERFAAGVKRPDPKDPRIQIIPAK